MKEAVFYIHGVTPVEAPVPHHNTYAGFHQGVSRLVPEWPSLFGGAEWGWNPGADTSHDQQLLSQAQRQLGNRVIPAIGEAKDFSLNPARLALNQLRQVMFYGFSDVFYYTSNTGKEAVRTTICEQLVTFLQQQKIEQEPIRISFVGHSAGAVIAFDLLFHLFHPMEPPYDSHCFIDPEQHEVAKQLRCWADAKQLQLRRLITMGNPLSSMAFRHSRVVEAIAAGEHLDPSHYGLNPDENLPGPRWINLWDLDDPLAWPVEPLMDTEQQTVADVYVNVSDWVTKAHNAYWTSKTAFKAVADHW
jgi:hypothetical protein